MTRVEAGLAALFSLAVVVYALANTRPRGDSGEYVLMAAAFAIHATPDVRAEDVRWVARTEPRLGELMERLESGMSAEKPVVLGSIHRAPDGRYYSFHFWFYSLLAAIPLWPLTATGVSPIIALALVNALALVGASFYAAAGVRGVHRFLVPLAFFISGTTFYAAWTGPEALTAAAVLVACFAAMRGRAGHALLAIGVATAQNPGALALTAFVVGWWWLLHRDREARWLEGSVVPRLDRPTVLYALSGAILVLASPLFFQLVFGVPSLIAKYTTDPELVSGSRAFSLLFDLNQGMVAGVPGVLLGLLATACAFLLKDVSRDEQRRAVSAVAIACITVLLMIIPSLGTHNWNSGCGVFMRYAYWASMPLFATLVVLLLRLPAPRSKGLAVFAAVIQLAVVGLNGVSGDRVWYTRHGAIARFALVHFPSLYNPEPEIFLERTLRRETAMKEEAVVAWPNKDAPTKLLVGGKAVPRLRTLCQGEGFASASVVEVSGWRYLNGPFQCEGPR